MKYLTILVFSIWYLVFGMSSSFAVGLGVQCMDSNQNTLQDSRGNPIQCDSGLTCRWNPGGAKGPGGYCTSGSNSTSTSVDRAIGKIDAPQAIKNLGFGAAGISKVLSNLIQIIYIAAGVVFIFMMVIGAFQWIISGGDKERLSQARGRITNAIIGIVLLAVTFVIIRLIGQLTGFEFFTGQNTLLPTTSPSLNQQTLSPFEKCGEGIRSLGTCDELHGYFCQKSDEGGGVSRCMPRSTPTPTPAPNINPLDRLPCNPGEC